MMIVKLVVSVGQIIDVRKGLAVSTLFIVIIIIVIASVITVFIMSQTGYLEELVSSISKLLTLPLP